MSFTDSRCFVDTNVFVYALDPTEPDKTKIARRVLRDLVMKGSGIVSEQVILELFNVLVNKLKIDRERAHSWVSKLFRMEILFPNDQVLRNALDLAYTHQLSVWDAHIVASAIMADARYLLSEDLNQGQKFIAVQVVNPFSLS